jgi:hypothetical protein
MPQARPAPLTVCSVCGARSGLRQVDLILRYTPAGNLLTWMVNIYYQRQLKTSLPMCARCLEGLGSAKKTFFACYAIGVLVLIGAFTAWFRSQAPSPWLLYGGLAVFVAAAMSAEYLFGKAVPRVVSIDKSQAVLSIPGQGQVTVS